MKMPDAARRERQRNLIEKGIDSPLFLDHIKVFDKTFGEIEAQRSRTKWLASDMFTLADIEITPYVERIDRLGLARMWEGRPHLEDWFKRVKARPSFIGSLTTHRPTSMIPGVTASKIGRGSRT